MRVQLYGRLADAAGSELEIAAPGKTVAELRMRIAELYPQLGALADASRNRACIGDCIVTDDSPLADVGLVEFFPPVSGG